MNFHDRVYITTDPLGPRGTIVNMIRRHGQLLYEVRWDAGDRTPRYEMVHPSTVTKIPLSGDGRERKND